MSIKTINISIDVLINVLKGLNKKAKDEIFEKVFIEGDREPLSKEEKEAMIKAEQELREGKTIKWSCGR